MSIIKQKKDIILLIMNCHNYKYKAQKQLSTWLPLLSKDILYFHVLGDPLLKEPFIIDTNNPILYVKCDDGYNSLPKKVIRAFDAIDSTYDFQYIFKTDDDQNVIDTKVFETIRDILLKKVPKVHYAGSVVPVPVAYKSEYYRIHPELPCDLIIHPTSYCSGRFYALSSEAVFNLIHKKEKIEMEFLEDYAIGLNLSPFLKKTMLNLSLSINRYIMDFTNYDVCEKDKVYQDRS